MAEEPIIGNMLLLLACLLAGLALQRTRRVPDDAHVAINAVIIHVSLPALTLHYLHGFSFESRHLLAVAMPWLLFTIGALLFYALGRALALPRRSVGALTLVGGFGNTSFVGLPMIESLHGRDGLPLGLLIDQLGSYLALSTVGVLAAALYAGDTASSARAVVRKVLGFPPFIAMVLALLLAPVPYPEPLDFALARIGDTLAPLALLSVGLQLRFNAVAEQARALALGLGYKLFMCPALTVALLLAVDAPLGMATRVTVIESAMPPMIGAGIVAAQAGLDARLVSMMIGFGIALAFATVPAWNWVFGMLVA